MAFAIFDSPALERKSNPGRKDGIVNIYILYDFREPISIPRLKKETFGKFIFRTCSELHIKIVYSIGVKISAVIRRGQICFFVNTGNNDFNRINENGLFERACCVVTVNFPKT
jgi:hypothetical protein